MEKQQILAGVREFFKKLFLGLGLVIAVVIAIVWFSSGDDTNQAQRVAHEQIDIVVSSQSVKEVGGKFRYFFNIKNNDTKPFSGDVNIDLINAEGDSIYDKTFSTNQSIASGLGTSVYFDINTGPTSVHGANGVKTYSYTVKADGQTIKTGSGAISSLSQ